MHSNNQFKNNALSSEHQEKRGCDRRVEKKSGNRDSKFELVETIKMQDELINQQAETILSLVNETVEQESIIGDLMRGTVC